MECCKGFEKKIFDYVDDLVPTPKRKEIENHLNDCSPCSEVLEQTKSLRHQLRSLPTHQTSEDFQTVLRTRIRLERSIGRQGIFSRPIRIPMYAAAGVAMAIAAFFMLSVFTDTNQPSQPGNPQLATPFNARGTAVSSNARTVPNPVNFPMDWVNVSGRGTSINSTELSNFSATQTDSVRGVNAREVSTFEF